MDFTISRINVESVHELIDFYKNQNIEKLSSNIIAMYTDIEGLQKRLANNIDIIYTCKINDRIVGILSAITNRISNSENDSWSILSFYILDEYKDTVISDKLLNQFIDEIRKTTAFKITTTFPADDVFQQMQLIKNDFKQEGYFKNGIKRGKDLVSYSLLLE